MQKKKILMVFVFVLVLGITVILVGYLFLQQKLTSSRKQLMESTTAIVARYTPPVDSIPQASKEGMDEFLTNAVYIDDEIEQKEEALELINDELQGFDWIRNRNRPGIVIYRRGDNVSAFLEDENRDKDWNTLTEDEQKAVIQIFDTNRKLILKIRELAKSGGPLRKLDFQSEYQYGRIPKSFFTTISDCEKLLLLDAFVATVKGEYNEAVQDYIALLQLAKALNNEPLLSSQGVATRIVRTVCVRSDTSCSR